MSGKHPVKTQARWKICVPDGPYAGEYPTVVEAVSEKDRSVAVGMPIARGEVVPIPVGTRVRVEQSGQAVYIFETVVTAHRDEGAPLLVVKVPEKYTRVQRRMYVRMSMTTRARVEIIGKNGDAQAFEEMQVSDLSAGGVGLISPKPMGKGTLIRLIIPSLDLNTMGEVVRVIPNGPENSPIDYSVGVKFVQLSEGEATRITKMIFQEQLNLRRRGLA